MLLALDDQWEFFKLDTLILSYSLWEPVVDGKDIPEVSKRFSRVEELTSDCPVVVMHLDPLFFTHRMEKFHGKLFEKADFFGLVDHPLGLSQLREDFEVFQHAIPLFNHTVAPALCILGNCVVCLLLGTLKLFDDLLA